MPKKKASASKGAKKKHHGNARVRDNKPSGKGISSYSEAFAVRLTEVAEAAGGKAELDRLLELSPGTIAKYTRPPYRVPGAELLSRIVERTGCNAYWLLTGKGKREPGQTDQELLRALDILTQAAQRLENVAEAGSRKSSIGEQT